MVLKTGQPPKSVNALETRHLPTEGTDPSLVKARRMHTPRSPSSTPQTLFLQGPTEASIGTVILSDKVNFMQHGDEKKMIMKRKSKQILTMMVIMIL